MREEGVSLMPLYRKKPVIIEAHKLRYENIKPIAEWCNGFQFKSGIQIETLEGIMVASIGDYIIKGVQGEFYPCKPEIFYKTYELYSY